MCVIKNIFAEIFQSMETSFYFSKVPVDSQCCDLTAFKTWFHWPVEFSSWCMLQTGAIAQKLGMVMSQVC